MFVSRKRYEVAERERREAAELWAKTRSQLWKMQAENVQQNKDLFEAWTTEARLNEEIANLRDELKRKTEQEHRSRVSDAYLGDFSFSYGQPKTGGLIDYIRSNTATIEPTAPTIRRFKIRVRNAANGDGTANTRISVVHGSHVLWDQALTSSKTLTKGIKDAKAFIRELVDNTPEKPYTIEVEA